ncbi:helix-turn-helix domain-containing protein, partial [Bacillus altitudinis]|uniref:helix-turn-helix domain-containing protein n=1 Tax=Bacillus altitudinis TaxID=293387 RepID=UPI00119D38AF
MLLHTTTYLSIQHLHNPLNLSTPTLYPQIKPINSSLKTHHLSRLHPKDQPGY